MITEPYNRRKYTRIPFDRQVKLDFIDESYYSRVKNLSLSGMFIRGNFKNHPGKYCIVDLYQSEETIDLCLRASAKVVRKDDKGIAIEFVSMSLDSIMFLQSTLPEPDEYPCDITDYSSTFPEKNFYINN